MNMFLQKLGIVLLLLVSFSSAYGQDSVASASLPLRTDSTYRDFPAPPPLITPDLIISSFVAAETRVREALNQYTFKRDVVLQTIGPDGEVTGEYIRNSQFLFDDRGNRIERVVYRPESTLKGMKITKEDIQDLEGAQLLGIDITETGKYRLEYSGSENTSTGPLFVIRVSPVQPPNPKRMRERFFVGRIWIDPETFQIVKVHGRVEPQGKQRFPTFQTVRELKVEQLNFPSLTEADDILQFPQYDVHYRVRVRCYDYKRFASKVILTEIDSADE
jgi:hypothetical protein